MHHRTLIMQRAFAKLEAIHKTFIYNSQLEIGKAKREAATLEAQLFCLAVQRPSG